MSLLDGYDPHLVVTKTQGIQCPFNATFPTEFLDPVHLSMISNYTTSLSPSFRIPHAALCRAFSGLGFASAVMSY